MQCAAKGIMVHMGMHCISKNHKRVILPLLLLPCTSSHFFRLTTVSANGFSLHLVYCLIFSTKEPWIHVTLKFLAAKMH